LKDIEWLKRLQASGTRVPVLEELPVILPHAQYYWQAFQTLSSRRLIIDSKAQAISISEVLAYVQFMGINDAYGRRDFLRIMMMLDAVYLSFKPTPPKRGK
jgi:hypothetical protein